MFSLMFVSLTMYDKTDIIGLHFQWVKRCRARRERKEYMPDPKIDENQYYGVYYR